MRVTNILFAGFVVSMLFGSISFAGASITPGTIPNAGQYDVQGSIEITQPSGFLQILAKIVQITYTVFFIIAIFIFLLVAFQYLISQGEPAEIKKAQDWLIYAAVAVVLALIAVGASTIIRGFIEDAGRPSSVPQPNSPGP